MSVENNELDGNDGGQTPNTPPASGESWNDKLANHYNSENNNQAFAKMRIQNKENQNKVAELEAKLAEKDSKLAELSKSKSDNTSSNKEQFNEWIREKEEAKIQATEQANQQAKKDIASLKEQGFSENELSEIIDLRVNYTKDLKSAVSLYKKNITSWNSKMKANANGNFNSQWQIPKGFGNNDKNISWTAFENARNSLKEMVSR